MNAQVRHLTESRFETVQIPSSTINVPMGGYAQRYKRWLDLCLLFLTAPVAVPLVAICALAVSLTGQMPFYRQTRIGREGIPFTMWKLRTMTPNASTRLEDLLRRCPRSAEEWRLAQKLRRDPRVTRLGRVLRRTSLDELPQLWNVFRGEMSLVGPRPFLPEQEKMYPGTAYYALRPGLTGFWQVSLRNETAFAERAAFDAQYARKMSLGFDLKIMTRTLGAVLRASGV